MCPFNLKLSSLVVITTWLAVLCVRGSFGKLTLSVREDGENVANLGLEFSSSGVRTITLSPGLTYIIDCTLDNDGSFLENPWTKDSVELPQMTDVMRNDPLAYYQNTHASIRVLYLHEFDSSLSGNYTCLSTDDAKTLQIHASNPAIVLSTDYFGIKEGASESLIVGFKAFGDPAPVTTPLTHTWYFQGNEVSSGLSIAQVGGQFIFLSAQGYAVAYSGEYTITIQTTAGTSNASFVLDVFAFPSLKFESSCGDCLNDDQLSIVIGTSDNVSCVDTNSFPISKLTWFRGGTLDPDDLLIPDDHLTIEMVTPRESKLVFTDVDLSYMDKYSCKANNSLLKDVKSVNVFVLYPPQVNVISPPSIDVLVGGDLVILIEYVGGNPDPSTTWTHLNGTTPLSENERAAESGDHHLNLTIVKCEVEDGGVYRLSIDNGVGNVILDYTVCIQEFGSIFSDINSVSFVDIDQVYISIDCEVNNLSCFEKYPQFIEQIKSSIPSGITFNRTVDIVDSCKHNGYYSFGPYNDRFIGIMTVVPVNNPEQINASQIRISTFHVQRFTLDILSDTTVQLTCFFALNSSADGCNVTFNSINQSVLVSVFIPKDNTIAVTTYTGIPEGDSVVNVYDVVEGVSDMSLPALKNLVYIILYPGSNETTIDGGTSAYFSSTVTKTLSTGTSPSVTMDTSVATNNALAIIIVVGVVIIVILIIAILIVVMIVAMKNSRKRKQVTLTQEIPLVLAEPHDYTNAEDLRKPAVEGIYHEHRSNFLPPNNNIYAAGCNNTLHLPSPIYENANNLFARKGCNSKPLDDDNSDDISEDNVSVASEEFESFVESTTDPTNGHLVMTSGPPPLPLKTTSFIEVPAGDKLDNSQYATVGFSPNEEVEGPVSQPQSQYATVKVKSDIVLSMETRPHNDKSQVVHSGDIHHAPVTTTSTVSSVDEHSALSRGNNNTYNSVSEVTHNTLISDVKPSPCDTIQERLILTESANIYEDHKSFVGYFVPEQDYDYCEEAFAVSDLVSKSQIIVRPWNDILEDIRSELVYSLEKPIHYEHEEMNPGNETQRNADNNLEIHGIVFAVADWEEIDLGYNFINYCANTLVDTLGHGLKKIICTSVVCNGSKSLPVFDVWLKRKIGLIDVQVHRLWWEKSAISVEGTGGIYMAGYNWKKKLLDWLPA